LFGGDRLGGMPATDAKADLHRYFQVARDALLWKLDGLSDYDVRRPMTPTGTNLLGLVKHVASVELGYFGEVFGRPSAEPLPWLEPDAEPNADMWATADESPEEVVALYRRAAAHADDTIESLALDATGVVPWWPDDRKVVTLHRILVHMTAETNRHAGHADIIRELIDGAAGLRADNDNLAPGDEAWWADYRARLEHVAVQAGNPSGPPSLRWTGVCIDCADAEALADFYGRLLGWEVTGRDGAGWISMRDPGGGTGLLFQAEAAYRPPAWPEQPGGQDKMLHFEIRVPDLDAAVAHAIAAGGRQAEYQPQERVRVMLDPAGHPFCLYLD
jgi:catechol 2,3-dioxygenase-like lactoylglutathione lyase family enzyme/uncharacterized damage-inducible protein DinB